MRSILLVLLAAAAAPAAAGDPLRPLPASQWTMEAAAHLLRRAGFSGTPDEVARLFLLGPDAAVDALLDFEGKPDPRLPEIEIALTEPPDREAMASMTEEQRQEARQRWRRADLLQVQQVREWWVRAMIATEHPLRERMTLFWHGHFTSGYRDVRNSYHMFVQNTLFRRHAAGNFRTLLHAVAKDPAMLEYLDNNRNRKGAPNENFAREVMELFTMGSGNYTEKDIKEAARAFTGWTFDGNEFVFRRGQHDQASKTFLGRTGTYDGDEILDIILAQTATPRFLARKLFECFAHQGAPDDVVEALARVMWKSDYELKPVLRALFRSEAFYSDRARATRIKSPVELIVGLHRELALEPPQAPVLTLLADTLGQRLLDPPNVKGWDGGRAWITTSHLLNRYNVASAIVGLPRDRLRALRGGRAGGAVRAMARMRAAENEEVAEEMGPERVRERFLDAVGDTYDAIDEVESRGLRTAEQIVDHFTGRLLAVPAPEAMRASLLEYMDGYEVLPRRGKIERLHGLLRLVVSTPEFQLS